ncbi:MAG: biopolymer transporter ExbD [Acidobacteria bacterium]|nr:biopolymer transporter ExbD [Acidobacteriota bacterium]
MSMDVGGAKGGLKADINVTPLVDVMLVLLIIVMLIAPMLQKGIDVNLPEAENTGDKPDTADQTVVHIDRESKLYVNAKLVNESDAITRLQAILETKADKIVYLKGDKDAPYSAIMKMMDALRGAGIETVGLITEKKGGNIEGGN